MTCGQTRGAKEAALYRKGLTFSLSSRLYCPPPLCCPGLIRKSALSRLARQSDRSSHRSSTLSL